MPNNAATDDAVTLLSSSSWRPSWKFIALGVLLVFNLVGLINLQVYNLSMYNEAHPDYYYNRRGASNDIRGVVGVGWAEYQEIGFTNLGWFHRTETVDSPSIPRGLVMRDFVDSVEANPRFNANLWSDMENSPISDYPIVAFLDIDLCFTVHWPKFGGNYVNSSDTENGRPPMSRPYKYKTFDENGFKSWTKDPCQIIDMALSSPAITASPHSRLVILSSEWREGPINSTCLGPNRNSSKYKQLVIGHMSQQFSQVNAKDFGIPPWPVKVIEDFPREKVCNESLPYLISFKGRIRSYFPQFHHYFVELAKQRDDVFIEFGSKHYTSIEIKDGARGMVQGSKEIQANETYYQLMIKSQFCPVPRGDNIFSVRFSEVMSSGCIPIIYADGWVLPYTRAVIDWNDVALIIPQGNVHHTMDYIEQMTPSEICRRRLLVYDFFHKYIKTGEGRVNAVMKILDERLRTGKLDQFQYAPGISTHDSSLAAYQLKQ